MRRWTLVVLALAGSAVIGCAGQEPSGQIDDGTSSSALVPPPPVNQYLGMYDTTISNFTAQTCLDCHKTTPATPNTPNTICTDATQICLPVADRHHAAMAKPGSTLTCTTCHTPDPTLPAGITVTVNCLVCHTTSPHHGTASALARHCADCHGSLVTNFDDGHYIPSYAVSMVTPGTGDSQCKVDKSGAVVTGTGTTANNCKSGACTACHQPSTAVTPAILSNSGLHHGTGIGSIPGTSCLWCHQGTAGVLDIRTCETCHGIKALHNIQFTGNATTGPVSGPGYGHIGTDQDCWGCHGFFNKYDVAPLQGATVPVVYSVDKGTLTAGTATTLNLAGTNFTNSVTYPTGVVYTYNPTLLLVPDSGSPLPVTPTSFTATTLTADVPANLAAGNWALYVVKDYQGAQQSQSNRANLAVESAAIIAAVKSCQGTNLTLTATGCVANAAPPPVQTNPTAAIRLQSSGNSCATPTCTTFTAAAYKTISFDASASKAVAPATVVSYRWTITRTTTDGTSVVRNSGARYLATTLRAGTYGVSLKVTDSAGKTSTTSIALTVR